MKQVKGKRAAWHFSYKFLRSPSATQVVKSEAEPKIFHFMILSNSRKNERKIGGFLTTFIFEAQFADSFLFYYYL